MLVVTFGDIHLNWCQNNSFFVCEAAVLSGGLLLLLPGLTSFLTNFAAFTSRVVRSESYYILCANISESN
jgi:hypothetical protein